MVACNRNWSCIFDMGHRSQKFKKISVYSWHETFNINFAIFHVLYVVTCMSFSFPHLHTKPTPISRFVQGYAGAVTAAVGIAVRQWMLVIQMIVARRLPLLQKKWFCITYIMYTGGSQFSVAKSRQVLPGQEDDGSTVHTVPCSRSVVYYTSQWAIAMHADLLASAHSPNFSMLLGESGWAWGRGCRSTPPSS